jgi:ABC-type branched-subunit amino acid transport system substrate-binding protein
MILESLPLLDLIRLNLTSSQQNVDADEGDESSVVQAPTEPLYRLSRSDTAKVDWLERNVYVDTHTQEAGTVTLDMDAVSLSSSSDSFALCHIANYGTLTLGNAIPTPTGHKELVGVALALQHLNTGDGSVIKQVQDLHKRCNVKFTLEIKDDELDRAVAVKNTLEYLDRPPQDAQNRRPCAFLGARSSDFTGRTAMLTSIQDYLHVGPLLFAPDLDDPNLFPLFARTSSTEHDTSVAFVHLLNQWNIKRFAVINRNDAWGNELADTLRQAIAHHAPDIEMHQIPLDDRPQSITQAIQALKRTQYQYVYVAIYNLNNAFDRLMQEAVHQNVAGNGIHTWFFHGTIVDALNKPYPKDSDLAKAYHGIGTVALISYIPTRDPSLPRTPGDAFLGALRELYNPEDVQYLNSIFPHEQHQNSPKFNESIQSVHNGDFIQEIASPEGYVRGEGMYYDATMAIGLAACDAMAKHGANFTGKQHYDALTANTFEGVTGTVLFNSTTGNRDPSTVTYTVTNRIAKEVNETHVVFDPVFTHKFIDRQWKPFPGTEFIFNNGETAIPLDIPAITTQDNAISPAVRGTVLGMCAVSILLAICLSTWAVRHKFTHVVRASQPFFLHSISIGTIIFASAIIPMSMDQGVLDEDGATVACNATVWLVSLGFCVTFSALFTKNYRINKILTSSTSMRRINVSLLDVAIPMMCLVSGTQAAASVYDVSFLDCLTSFAFEYFSKCHHIGCHDSLGADSVRNKSGFGRHF